MAAQSGSIAKTSVEPSEIALLAFVERAESSREKIWQTPATTNHHEEDELGRPFGWCLRVFPPVSLLRVTQRASRLMLASPCPEASRRVQEMSGFNAD